MLSFMNNQSDTKTYRAGAADPRRALHVLEQMYDAYLDSDSDNIDALLAPDITIFDSAHSELIVGLDDLEQVRQLRPKIPNGVSETKLTMSNCHVFDKGDDLLAAYWLQVDYEDSDGRALTPELSRNSAWLRQRDGSWKVTHLHEDVWQQGGETISAE